MADWTHHLEDGLRESFTLAELRRLLRRALDLDLDDYAMGEDKREIVFKLVQHADKKGWARDLAAAAIATAPRAPALLQLRVPLGIVEKEGLERMVHANDPFIDAHEHRRRLGQALAATCCIWIGSRPAGTGFLIGPDRVMTCHHVIRKALEDKSIPTAFFDYGLSGRAEDRGVPYELAEEWRVSASEELDYAVCKLRRPAGAHVSGRDAHPTDGEEARGHLDATHAGLTDEGASVVIVQHPSAAPLKLSMGRVTGARPARIRYDANTLPGSSGSPVFDASMRLIAVHRSGDPAFNEGVDLAAVRAHLASP